MKNLKIESKIVLLMMIILIWTAPYLECSEIVVANSKYDESNPAIAIEPDGGFDIVYAYNTLDETTSDIILNRYDDSGALKGESIEVEFENGLMSNPQIALLPDGKVAVTYVRYSEGSTYVPLRIFDSEGTYIGGNNLSNKVTLGTCKDPSIDSDEYGNTVVAWYYDGYSGYDPGVYARVYSVLGNPITDVIQVNQDVEDYLSNPKVAINKKGDVIISWQKLGTGSESGKVTHWFAVGSVGQLVQEEKFDTYKFFTRDAYAFSQDIVLDDNGSIYDVWTELTSSNGYDIFIRKYDIQVNPISVLIQISDPDLGSHSNPSIDISPDQNTLAISWETSTPRRTVDLFAVFLDKDLNQMGEVFQVNDTTYYSQGNPDVSILTKDYYAIAWNIRDNATGKYNYDVLVDFVADGSPPTGDKISFELGISPFQAAYNEGDSFDLDLTLKSPDKDTMIDLYWGMLNQTTGSLYFAPAWDTSPKALLQNFTLPASLEIDNMKILNVMIPQENPLIASSGTYTFAVVAAKPGTLDFVSNIATASFMVGIK